MVGREGKGRELGGGERDGGMKKEAGRGDNWEGVRDGGKKGGGSVVVKKTLVQTTTSKLALKVVVKKV